MYRLLLLLSAGSALVAQDLPPKTGSERDSDVRRSFETAIANDPESALPFLPRVIDQPWVGEVSFRDACELARAAAQQNDGAGALAGRLVLAAGLHNPALALRESGEYLAIENGPRLFERFVLAAPGEAMALAAGTSKSARSLRELISGAGPPEFPLLLRLADDSSIDLPRRQRVAVFAGRIVRGQLSFEAALKMAGDTARFFAAVVDMRAAAGADGSALDLVLENESLVLCRAARESLERTVASDLARFRARDLYVLLALGRAEATPELFAVLFDRLVLRPDELLMLIEVFSFLGASLLICFADAEPILFVPQIEPRDHIPAGLRVQEYPWGDLKCSDPYSVLVSAVGAELRKAGANSEQVGVSFSVARTSLPIQAAEQIPIPEGFAGQLSAFSAKPDAKRQAAFADLYLRKTAEEIDAIRRANRVANVGLQAFFENLQPGIAETEVAAAVESAIYRQIGIDGIFHSRGWAMVQAGPNSALAGQFNRSTARRLENGDLVLIELATCVNGYWS